MKTFLIEDLSKRESEINSRHSLIPQQVRYTDQEQYCSHDSHTSHETVKLGSEIRLPSIPRYLDEIRYERHQKHSQIHPYSNNTSFSSPSHKQRSPPLLEEPYKHPRISSINYQQHLDHQIPPRTSSTCCTNECLSPPPYYSVPQQYESFPPRYYHVHERYDNVRKGYEHVPEGEEDDEIVYVPIRKSHLSKLGVPLAIVRRSSTDYSSPTIESPEVCSKSSSISSVKETDIFSKSLSKLDGRIKKKDNRAARMLPPKATEVLKHWYDLHTDHPYPSHEDKQHLINISGLTLHQVNTWFVNRR